LKPARSAGDLAGWLAAVDGGRSQARRPHRSL